MASGKDNQLFILRTYYTLIQSKINLNITEKNYEKVGLELYSEVAEAYSLFRAKEFS
jgi:hypothetical protein